MASQRTLWAFGWQRGSKVFFTGIVTRTRIEAICRAVSMWRCGSSHPTDRIWKEMRRYGGRVVKVRLEEV